MRQVDWRMQGGKAKQPFLLPRLKVSVSKRAVRSSQKKIPNQTVGSTLFRNTRVTKTNFLSKSSDIKKVQNSKSTTISGSGIPEDILFNGASLNARQQKILS